MPGCLACQQSAVMIGGDRDGIGRDVGVQAGQVETARPGAVVHVHDLILHRPIAHQWAAVPIAEATSALLV